jgi:starch synthase
MSAESPAILYVASEAAPLIKVGGLADVAMSLPPALREQGAHVDLALPLYGRIRRERGEQLRPVDGVPGFSRNGMSAEFFELTIEETGVRAWLIGNDAYFDRDHPYTDADHKLYTDTLERFVFFQLAVLHLVAWLRAEKRQRYDVIHANDHQSALLPVYLSETAAGDACGRPLSVLTIHNLGYQGIYPDNGDAGMSADGVNALTGLPHHLYYPTSPLEFWGRMNCLKAGIEYADGVTTVSPTYATEIQRDDEHGFGLQDVLRNNRHKLRGIINGVDTNVWDPRHDHFLQPQGGKTYTVAEPGGKQACKRAVLERFGFTTAQMSRPLVIFIGRLVDQKGVPLIAHAVPALARHGASVAILGSGPDAGAIRELREQFPDRVGFAETYDEPLSHLMTAGADFQMMPSKYEPCGLNQMYATLYGSVPVVRRTGGLNDTVTDLSSDPETGTGILFTPFDGDAFLGALFRGFGFYNESRAFERIVRRNMRRDFSWSGPAVEYLQFYREIATRHGRSL